MPIVYIDEDDRTPERIAEDDRIREEVERTGGAWAQMTPEQRAEARALMKQRKAEGMALRVRGGGHANRDE